MKCGFVLPDLDVTTAPTLAALAEAAGWDGVFIPDCISIEVPGSPAFPASDPWVTLAAMALATSRVRLGPMVAAVPRRRPWKLAREVATLDILSGGRMILPVGIGAAADDAGFRETGEDMGVRGRAERMDEALNILAGLWRGEPFSHTGRHFQVGHMTQLPMPVQRPRVPVWVVGVIPARKSVERALRWDGIVVQKAAGVVTSEDIRELSKAAGDRPTPFDIIVEGSTNPGDPADLDRVARRAAAGATWWMESMWGEHSDGGLRDRIQAGPPSVGTD
jgi:alkanesulfonate monooxygenase SsuD/methylene tetrahydromethanopterin reductase-like flavin-dependent oxidoreductase (luciferase family)